jgi:hypothetical protein
MKTGNSPTRCATIFCCAGNDRQKVVIMGLPPVHFEEFRRHFELYPGRILVKAAKDASVNRVPSAQVTDYLLKCTFPLSLESHPHSILSLSKSSQYGIIRIVKIIYPIQPPSI